MKKFIAITALLTTLAGCTASSAVAKVRVEKVSTAVTHQVTEQFLWKDSVETSTMLAKQAIKRQQVNEMTTNLRKVVLRLKKTAGKTWYVFSGSTPSGWDCSGLVMWTYEQLGIQLEHRASIQANSGTKVKHPKVGDIVAFYYPGSKSAYHVGIYLGNGEMINAPKPGKSTTIEPVNNHRLAGSTIRYVRIVETN
jgi:cell wall-associated NlpC family hydrolase